MDGIVASCERISDYEVEMTVGYELADGSYSFYKDKYSSMGGGTLRYGEELHMWYIIYASLCELMLQCNYYMCKREENLNDK